MAEEFDLEIEEGVSEGAERILLYGTPGIGKSTWAAGAPDPFFLDLERGTRQLKVARNKKPIDTWEKLIAVLKQLMVMESFHYKTLVIDTLDRAEWLNWVYICKNNKIQRSGVSVNVPVESIEEVNGGYGKGYTVAYEEWRRFFGLLETVQRRLGIRVILLAHAKLENVPNPNGSDYMRYSLKLHKQAASMFYEVCDAVLFASHNVIAKKEGYMDGKRARGISDGTRHLYTREAPTHVAKNRYNLPDDIELSWDVFTMEVARGHSPDLLIETMRKKAAEVDESMLEKLEGGITRAGGDSDKLIRLSGWLDTQIQKIIERRAAEIEQAVQNQNQGQPGNGQVQA